MGAKEVGSRKRARVDTWPIGSSAGSSPGSGLGSIKPGRGRKIGTANMDGRAHDGPDEPDPEARGSANFDAGLRRGVAPSDSAVLPSGGVALVFRIIRALPFCHFRLARRGQLDFVPLWQGRPGSGETRLCPIRTLGTASRQLSHHSCCGNWYSPATLLMLFWMFYQLERQDASTCWAMRTSRQRRSLKHK